MFARGCRLGDKLSCGKAKQQSAERQPDRLMQRRDVKPNG